MYYGDSVLGAPVERTEKNRIIFEYAKVTHDEAGKATPKPDGEIGTLSMYPFGKGEMLSALREVREFSLVEVYSDLSRTKELEDDADFYTYVAWKRPKESL